MSLLKPRSAMPSEGSDAPPDAPSDAPVEPPVVDEG